jgi:drug/metabolite transporter (DMT)-like permease
MHDVALILAVVGMVIGGQVLMKVGMDKVGEVNRAHLRSPVALVRQVATTPAVVAGLGAYALSAVGWVYVLSRVELSYAYPFLGLAYIGVTALAVLMLKEPFTRFQWLGVAFTVAGVVTVAMTA